MKKRWSEFDAFFGGWKPALLFGAHEPRDNRKALVFKVGNIATVKIPPWTERREQLFQQLVKYPHVVEKSRLGTLYTEEGKAYTSQRYLFFQTEEKKAQYLALRNNEETKRMALGLSLGYPPKAVKAFEENRTGVIIEYNGLHFCSAKEDVFENVVWLWNNIPVPAEKRRDAVISTGQQRNLHGVPYGNEERLKDVQKRIKELIQNVLLKGKQERTYPGENRKVRDSRS